MTDENFKRYVIAFILFTLCGYLLVSSIIGVGNNYARENNYLSSSVNLSKYNETLRNIENSAPSISNQFTGRNVFSVAGEIVVEGIFGVAKSMTSLIIMPFYLVSDILLNVFELPQVVVNILLSLLIISIILAIWRLLKIGY